MKCGIPYEARSKVRLVKLKRQEKAIKFSDVLDSLVVMNIPQ